MLTRRTLALAVLALLALLAGSAQRAQASQLVDRGAHDARLVVNSKGEALITYRNDKGVLKHLLAWGAVNAVAPRAGAKQQKFKFDYAGGWGKYHKTYWKTFGHTCLPYDGPPLAYMVAACKAPDGSYWALQTWGVFYPDLGFKPWMKSQAPAMTLSHWTGDPAVLDVHADWVYGGKFHQLFGTYTYQGKPVFGYKSTKYGAPLDDFARLVYLDTYNAPAYGTGWLRENSFLPHQGSGGFCYGFFQFDPTKGGYEHPAGYTKMRGPGIGQRYRVSAEGPGVSPDVSVLINDPGAWDPNDPAKAQLEQDSNDLLDQLAIGGCAQH